MRRMVVMLCLSLAVVGCSGSEDEEVCADVDCSGHGSCVSTDGAAACDCDSGYEASGLECNAIGTGFAGACKSEESGICLEYTGSIFSSAAVQGACSENATYSAERCTTDALLGKCKMAAGTPNEVVTFYYPPNDGTSLQSSCASGGGAWENP